MGFNSGFKGLILRTFDRYITENTEGFDSSNRDGQKEKCLKMQVETLKKTHIRVICSLLTFCSVTCIDKPYGLSFCEKNKNEITPMKEDIVICARLDK